VRGRPRTDGPGVRACAAGPECTADQPFRRKVRVSTM
jgi:hypothetical protein